VTSHALAPSTSCRVAVGAVRRWAGSSDSFVGCDIEGKPRPTVACASRVREYTVARAPRERSAPRAGELVGAPRPPGRPTNGASDAGVCTRDACAARAAAAGPPNKGTRQRVGVRCGGHHRRRDHPPVPRAYVPPSGLPQMRPPRRRTWEDSAHVDRIGARLVGRAARRATPWPRHRASNGQHGKITRKTKMRHARVCAVSRALVGH